MKNLKFKKLLAGLLVTTCVTGLMTGCGNTANNEESKSSSVVSNVEKTSESKVEESKVEEKETEVTYPLELDKEVTLSFAMWGTAAALSGTDYKGISETPFAEEWQRATGVKVKFEEYADATAMNLMIAGGELPDIIFFNFNQYNGGIAKALDDKVAVALNDYMEFAPDFADVINSNENYRKAVTTSDGSIMGFPLIYGETACLNSLGFQIRKDFLDQIGEELPETADDFYNVLKAFKEELGVEIPFSVYTPYLYSYGLEAGLLTSPFGLPKCDFYVDEDEVHYGYYQQEFKDVLIYLNKLYDEGLMDPNFATVEIDTQRGNMMNGVIGVTMDTRGRISAQKQTMIDHPTFDLAGFGSLVAEEGDVAMSCMYGNPVSSYYAVITPACENIEVAMQFLNYGYSEEGHRLMNFGIEGDNYTLVNGEVVYTKEYTEAFAANSNVQKGYHRSWTGFPFVQEFDDRLLIEEQVKAQEAWANADAAKYQLPAITIPETDMSEYTKIMGDVKTYAKEMAVRFISGLEDMDNFEKVYLAELEKMGIEKVLEIVQTAYDEYNSR